MVVDPPARELGAQHAFSGTDGEGQSHQALGGEESRNRRFLLDERLIEVTDTIVAAMRAQRAPGAPRSTGDVLRTGLIEYAEGIPPEARDIDPDAKEPTVPRLAVEGLQAAGRAGSDVLNFYVKMLHQESGLTFGRIATGLVTAGVYPQVTRQAANLMAKRAPAEAPEALPPVPAPVTGGGRRRESVEDQPTRNMAFRMPEATYQVARKRMRYDGVGVTAILEDTLRKFNQAHAEYAKPR